MRIIIAALLGAQTCLPSLAFAAPLFPDPANAAASVPTLEVPSALASYRPPREQPSPGWSALNRAVTDPADGAGKRHASMHSGATNAEGDGHGAYHAEAAK
jgi:hypothetical protein